MANLPIRWLMASAYVHATEEEDRVRAALDTVCPVGETQRDEIRAEHGNRLVRLVRRTGDGKAIRAVWVAWEHAGVVAALRDSIDERLDEDGVVHLRLGKQQAYGRALALAATAGGDLVDVQLKLKAYPASPEELHRVARALVFGGT